MKKLLFILLFTPFLLRSQDIIKRGNIDYVGSTPTYNPAFVDNWAVIDTSSGTLYIRHNGWQSGSADNMGNCTATQNIDAAGFNLINIAELISNSNISLKLDSDNDETATLTVKDGADATIYTLQENGTAIFTNVVRATKVGINLGGATPLHELEMSGDAIISGYVKKEYAIFNAHTGVPTEHGALWYRNDDDGQFYYKDDNGVTNELATVGGTVTKTDWTTYTPTLEGVTLGNGINTAVYKVVDGENNKTLQINGKLYLGTTGDVTGEVLIHLPAGFSRLNTSIVHVGEATFYDVGDERGHATCHFHNTEDKFGFVVQMSGSNVIDVWSDTHIGEGDPHAALIEVTYSITIPIQ